MGLRGAEEASTSCHLPSPTAARLPSFTKRSLAAAWERGDELAGATSTTGRLSRPNQTQAPAPTIASKARTATGKIHCRANLLRCAGSVGGGAASGSAGVASAAWLSTASSSSSSLGTLPRPFHAPKLRVWNWRKPIGGETPSTLIGTSLPRSRPSAASSRTQADSRERGLHQHHHRIRIIERLLNLAAELGAAVDVPVEPDGVPGFFECSDKRLGERRVLMVVAQEHTRHALPPAAAMVR